MAPQGRISTWWIVFNSVPDVPEGLVQGKELEFLSWFYRSLAYNPAAVTQADINEFVSHYSAPGEMHAGFEYYRALPEDVIQNQNYSKTKLPMPVLALGGGYAAALGGNITTNYPLYDELKRLLGISSNVLAKKLKLLEQEGLVLQRNLKAS